MWAFLSSRLRTWVLLAVVVPIVMTIVRTVRKRLEAENGETKAVRALKKLEREADKRRGKAKRQG